MTCDSFEPFVNGFVVGALGVVAVLTVLSLVVIYLGRRWERQLAALAPDPEAYGDVPRVIDSVDPSWGGR